MQNHHWTESDISARIAKANKYAHLLHRASESAAPKAPTKSEEAAIRTAELNRRNRIQEAERVRKAQLEQQKQNKMEQKRAAARRKAEEEAKKKAEEEARSRNLDVDALFGGGDGEEKGASSRGGTPKPSGEKKKTERKGLPTFRRPKMDDDIIASMDIGVDIEI